MRSRLSPRTAAILGVLAVFIVGLGAAVLLGTTDDSSSGEDDGAAAAEPTDGPVAADLDRLRELSDAVGHPVYWAGEQAGREYELTIQEDGRIFIRYLDPGAAAGSPDLSLTVATYPFADAFEALEVVAGKRGSTRARTPDGGIVVVSAGNPTSAYVAYPGSDLEIEVYDPDPARALELATSGAVAPVE